MATWRKVIVSGSAAELASLTLDTALPVAQGGIGATSLTDKAVLISQDTGTDAIGALALTGNGEIIVGGTNGPAVEAAADVAGDGLDAAVGDGQLAINVAAAQTTITSVLATDVKIGEDDQTKVDFETPDEIHFYAANTQRASIDADGLNVSGSILTNSHISSSGMITGSDVFASGGIYGTLGTAAQGNVTSLGTLTTLTVDNVIINGTTIGHTDDGDLLTFADGELTAAGNITATGYVSGSVVSGSVLLNDDQANTKLSGSFTGSFFGDGSELTGVSATSLNIDLFGTDHTSATLATSDLILVSDGGDDGRANIGDLATPLAGTGLEASSDTIRLVAANTTNTSILNSSFSKIGTATDEEYIKFDTSNEVNVHINDTERLSVTATGIDVTGNAVISGDLTVQGDTTTLSTTNLAVGDAFIFSATGSEGSNVDGGLVVQSGSVAETGSALYHDINSERWSVAKSVGSSQAAVTPLQFVVTGDFSKQSAPDATSGSYGVGEMWVDDSDNIYIRTT